MSTTNNDPLVSIYTSLNSADAEIVKNMLIANGIRATVAESEGPFVGLTVAPSNVLVFHADEARARELIRERDPDADQADESSE
jgi:hypothetical protein